MVRIAWTMRKASSTERPVEIGYQLMALMMPSGSIRNMPRTVPDDWALVGSMP
ncbi:hypothetical protein D3C71_2157610 [compost metagenome]